MRSGFMHPESLSDLGKRFQAVCDAKGWNVTELATALGLSSAGALADPAYGRGSMGGPSYKLFEALEAETFGAAHAVPVEELAPEEEEERPVPPSAYGVEWLERWYLETVQPELDARDERIAALEAELERGRRALDALQRQKEATARSMLNAIHRKFSRSGTEVV